MIEKSGSVGEFSVKLKSGDETISLTVGAILVATGFENYQPKEGEFGFGLDGVVTLPEFHKRIAESKGSLQYQGRPVNTIAYVYCVGSRQSKSEACPPKLGRSGERMQRACLN